MCYCKNVEVGTYKNQIEVDVPVEMRNKFSRKIFSLDTCISSEVKSLWRKGIVTTGCCCGHNKLLPYIGVYGLESINKMKELGYSEAFNQFEINDHLSKTFYPNNIEVDFPYNFNKEIFIGGNEIIDIINTILNIDPRVVRKNKYDKIFLSAIYLNRPLKVKDIVTIVLRKIYSENQIDMNQFQTIKNYK